MTTDELLATRAESLMDGQWRPLLWVWHRLKTLEADSSEVYRALRNNPRIESRMGDRGLCEFRLRGL
jgi:hypothetical protein